MAVTCPARDEGDFTPRSSCWPSVRWVAAGVLDGANRLTVDGVVVTLMSNVSLAESAPRSAAATLTLRVPTSADVGVPLNVRVDPLKVSQAGNAVPSARVA